MKKCTKCRVPLEGILSKISKIFGVKPSTKQGGVCNKCEDKPEEKKVVEEPTSQSEDASV
ncbi:MAG: hypothetical protein AAB525_02535 [Patescibacteria group bacterium]